MIGTDFTTYMKTDGIVADNRDAYEAAFQAANARTRRLSEVPEVEILEVPSEVQLPWALLNESASSHGRLLAEVPLHHLQLVTLVRICCAKYL